MLSLLSLFLCYYYYFVSLAQLWKNGQFWWIGDENIHNVYVNAEKTHWKMRILKLFRFFLNKNTKSTQGKRQNMRQNDPQKPSFTRKMLVFFSCIQFSWINNKSKYKNSHMHTHTVSHSTTLCVLIFFFFYWTMIAKFSHSFSWNL